MIKAIVGSGGKTTLIHHLAKQYLSQGYKVLVTTSTHMYKEDNTIGDDAKSIIEALDKDHYAMAGNFEGHKITALCDSTFQEVVHHADIVLIEADGSKQLPLKYPSEHEPVIDDYVDEIIIVSSLLALGKKAKDCIHRYPLAKRYLSIQEDDLIQPHHIQELLRQGYLKPLSLKYPKQKITIHINHDNSLYQRVITKLIEADIDVSLIDQRWFTPIPHLMICGGGHVSYELAKMASQLDFHIKVMDDRQEFANRERFPFVDEVICDSFDHIEHYLSDQGYYVVVTRGHKDDYICVKAILQHAYDYIGMIGSKRKVQKTFEQLQQEGFNPQNIHAPIGLNIHAKTPAEIAVSILAEIIFEKNQHICGSLSEQLLHYQGKGTLCIIIEKHGSSPRGVGSMMLVNEEGIIDSIGGGSIENAVIQEARHLDHVKIHQYELNNKDSEKLGMICGGRNTILFVPL